MDVTEAELNPEGVPTISELIHTQRDSTGDSYREMADRAAAAGYTIKFQTLQELATVPPRGWPKKADTFKALAHALQVSERAVVLAYARSFGLDVSEGSSLLEVLLPAGTRDVDRGLQQAIAGVVRAAVSAQHTDGSDTDGTPMTQPNMTVVEDTDEAIEVEARPAVRPTRAHPAKARRDSP